jgi:hypothetical protein
VQELEDHQQQALLQLAQESQPLPGDHQQQALLQLAQESQQQQALQQLGQVLGWQPEQQPLERREHQIQLLHPRLRQ